MDAWLLSSLIQRYVYYFGVWEPAISQWFRGYVRPGDIVVDVGANVGWYTLLAAQRVGTEGQVVAIEASPIIATRLQANLALNPSLATPVTVYNGAAGDREGMIPLYAGNTQNSGSTSIHQGTDMVLEGTVPMRSLSSLLSEFDLTRLRVIKVDVEGAEPLVLEGLLPIAEKLTKNAALVVEIVDSPLRETLVASLADVGFRCAGLFPNIYKPDPYLAREHLPFLKATVIPPGQWDVLFVKN